MHACVETAGIVLAQLIGTHQYVILMPVLPLLVLLLQRKQSTPVSPSRLTSEESLCLHISASYRP